MVRFEKKNTIQIIKIPIRKSYLVTFSSALPNRK